MSNATEPTDSTFVEAAKLRGKLPGLVDKMTPEERAEFDRIMAEVAADEEGE